MHSFFLHSIFEKNNYISHDFIWVINFHFTRLTEPFGVIINFTPKTIIHSSLFCPKSFSYFYVLLSVYPNQLSAIA